MAEPSDNKQKRRTAGAGKQGREDLSSYVFGKVPPQAVPLEEAILGAILLEKDALTQVLDVLQHDAFYVDAHQMIYSAFLRLFERSQPIDLLTVMEELKKEGELEAIGGPAYLAELSNKVASAANIEYHARIVAQKFIQRELIRISTKTINDAFEDTTDVFDLLDNAETNLFKIAERNMGRSVDRMGALASKLLKQIEELKDTEDGLTGVPTGFTDLDRLTSGFQKSDLIILAARPGMGKCLGKGTPVLMYDGSIKAVEDIQVGDLLMGDDSTPRTVLTLARGQERMYWVRQNKGMDYRVNESHILSLKKSRQEGRGDKGSVLDIEVRDYLGRSGKFQNNYKGYKVPVDFAERTLPLPPYFLGLWLGDGEKINRTIFDSEKFTKQLTEEKLCVNSSESSKKIGRFISVKLPGDGSSSKSSITNQDEEIVTYLGNYADQLGMRLHVYKGEGKCPEYRISNDAGPSSYSLQGQLREMGLLNNKHIPQDYLINSRENRLKLLAGLIDSDGRYLEQSNGFEITQKNKALTQQIKFLCDSLGYRVSMEAKEARITSIDYTGTVYRLRIYGNIDEVPCKVKRKQANPWKSLVDWQVTSIQLEDDGIDDYYGFEIDGNRRFLLGDMTVTHNTALTLSIAKNAALDFNKGVAIFSLEMSSLQLAQRIISMEAEIPGSKLRNGQLEEYEWQQLHTAIEKVADAPIFIDDTPGINSFELRAKCRRLKMQYDIQLIIIDYLQLMSGGGDNKGGNREQEVSAISRALKGLAKELNVPVIALSQLSRAVETRGGDKRPMLSDLRESGSIEQDADMVMFIYRPEYYQILEDEEGQSLKGVADLIIAKNRAGALTDVRMRFTGEFARFSNMDDPDFGDLPGDTFESPFNNIITKPSKMNDGEDIPF
jgi:replicative DNA helicase